jgi:hypothetical protein
MGQFACYLRCPILVLRLPLPVEPNRFGLVLDALDQPLDVEVLLDIKLFGMAIYISKDV